MDISLVSTYRRLITYQYRKIVDSLYGAVGLCVAIVLVFKMVDEWRRQVMSDIIIVGSSPLACLLQHKLSKIGVKTKIIAPIIEREYRFPTHQKNMYYSPQKERNIPLWIDDEMVEKLGEILDKIFSKIPSEISGRKFIIETMNSLGSYSFKSHPIIEEYAKDISAQKEDLFLFTIPKVKCDILRADISSLTFLDDVFRFDFVEDYASNIPRQRSILSRYVIVASHNDEIQKKFYKLNKPKEALVCCRYIGEGDFSIEYGGVIHKEKQAFLCRTECNKIITEIFSTHPCSIEDGKYRIDGYFPPDFLPKPSEEEVKNIVFERKSIPGPLFLTDFTSQEALLLSLSIVNMLETAISCHCKNAVV